MSELEYFLKTLAETIKGNKLSSSRVDRVKKCVTKCFHVPSLARSILKLHLRASSSTKVSSLYLFDAVVRFAKDIVKKNGSGFDASDSSAPQGSEALDGTNEALTAGAGMFMDKAAGVAGEIAKDAMKSVSNEQQEKVKKVVDIWIRAGTFDAKLLKDMQKDLAKAKSSKPRSTTPPTDPRNAKRRPKYPFPEGEETETPPVAVGLPANVLALLGGGAATLLTPPPAAGGDLMPSLSNMLGSQNQPTAPSFDLSQLTALQHLAAPPGPPPPRPPPRRSQSPAAPKGQARYNAASRSKSPTAAATFDMTKFDPTDATQWQQLGEMWKGMYGYLPANQELMFAVMGGMFPPQQGGIMGMMGGQNVWTQQQTQYHSNADRDQDCYQVPTQ